jgi:hypothetical protein
MRGRWLAGLSIVLGLCVTGAQADEVRWRPVPLEVPAPVQAVPQHVPAVTLGKPVVIASAGTPAPIRDAEVRAVSFSTAPPAVLGPVIRAQAPDSGPPPVPPPGTSFPPVPVPPPGDPYTGGPAIIADPNPHGDPFLGKFRQWFGGTDNCPNRKPFQSDHAFDYFSSPVTEPSFFEDPRSLTEVRPIFMLQTSPKHNWVFHDATTEVFNLQARVALTDQWSIVMQKFGFLAIQPGHDSIVPDEEGFTEINIGPKWTFLRSCETKTVGALGLTFEIPAGPSKIAQNTGDLSLRPYLSMAQSFGRSSYGTFNAMGTLGYDFGVDDKRSDFFFTNLHLDYNVANADKIYPFLELNWTRYTANGKERPFDFEGGDLFNFGSEFVSSRNIVTLAPGVRYKFSECTQVGTALEFPLSGHHDMIDFRWTIDVIFRY